MSGGFRFGDLPASARQGWKAAAAFVSIQICRFRDGALCRGAADDHQGSRWRGDGMPRRGDEHQERQERGGGGCGRRPLE